MYQAVFPRELTETEAALIDRGVVQIAALVAAKVTGRGLIINNGDDAYSWDFILVDASKDEQRDFDERVLEMITGYIQAGFPDAALKQVKHRAPKIAIKND
ncbi:hypothetical protein BW13_10125 [Bifidobacterium sp. UTCIF-37]|uniref:hypothetical protein n=1 Tax=unclassified Bifidobacterium TaxID=2608897 RepID=UPI00112D6396|nr:MULTISPECIES: hypothetical protein [unclassified Bifidobacterium]TPF85573.1 hypothetical protein BW13_10125 [Bifidobacterium sp. UTCIF-37]TPF87613.1 hypothetical protein BW11_10565 [Bifidobacterium sp. UTCIF-38]